MKQGGGADHGGTRLEGDAASCLHVFAFIDDGIVATGARHEFGA